MFKEAKEFINKFMEEGNLAFILAVGKIRKGTIESELL